MDLKPQNLMVFDGRLKLIDLDGCVEIGTSIRTTDTWFSFSLLYCAPEFARFVASRRKTSIVASSHLDAWSVGMTIAEVACLKPVLYSQYKHYKDMEATPGAGDLNFMEWLGNSKVSPVPEAFKVFDPQLFAFLSDCLCVQEPEQRMSLRRCAAHPYIAAGRVQRMAYRVG
uniref:Protein kinase domain-containing protein n=1 Tax=Noctiluca scintillans TaxID=2966 RepID=A0A7S1F6G4_NOCSC